MSAMASQITSLTIVFSTVYWGADQRKNQSSASLPFVRGIHRWPVNFPHKGPITRKMFPFDDVIMSSADNSSSMHRPLSNETYRCTLSKGRGQFLILCVYISTEIDKVQIELANQCDHVRWTLIGDWEWVCGFTFHAKNYPISLVPLNWSFHLTRSSRSVSCSYRYEARYYPTSTIDRYALLITRVGFMSWSHIKNDMLLPQV